MLADSLSEFAFEDSPQHVELSWSSERLAIRDRKEDWTGVTNPAEGRKLQNRLNQRVRSEYP